MKKYLNEINQQTFSLFFRIPYTNKQYSTVLEKEYMLPIFTWWEGNKSWKIVPEARLSILPGTAGPPAVLSDWTQQENYHLELKNILLKAAFELVEPEP